jgi:hypothetical protein
MAELLVLIKSAAKSIGLPKPPVNKLTIQMIRVGANPPKLKTKAAEGRAMLKTVFYMLTNIFPPENAHENLRLNCVANLKFMYDELEPSSWSQTKAPNVRRLARTHLLLYAELTLEAAAGLEGHAVLFYRIYPKHHLLVHCIEDGLKDFGNPRSFWCYGDENAIGDCADMCASLHKMTIHRSVITKHRLSA